MKELHIDNFDFTLPEELISHNVLDNRLQAKLLYVNGEEIKDYQVKDLLNFLNKDDLLIFNNTKVIPARLLGKKNNNQGATINITLHYRLDNKHWLSFIKNSKRLNIGDTIIFAEDFKCSVVEKLASGEVKLFFDYENLFELLQKYGFMPLPPYIKRENINNDTDKKNYQSIFAKIEGAVAAPTASLHFTNSLITELQEKGVKTAFLTLHVGAGTFLPVKVENILEHKMHKEFGSLSQDTINLIKDTQKAGSKIVAVGTTTMRVLEYVAKQNNGDLIPFEGEIDLFIYEGFKFHVVDKLITNFHLPKSTLFMLVSAFAGLNNMKAAYKHAIENKYRFFSYGDCCLLEKQKKSEELC
ncbi:MAG: tRNA preQ1(34) S-adenosylmethionine ribosyltransferase-isomerase QueA [Alphaproteobacteria bacterium]|jgi:S-adenosylmethionine:tRNA ribosyltransferase-isomerase|nr:tRNA preQ1(34) S-adenosylmethionine ribosyltransferase-isomerase QueA [Alphaproteobacteria bacterium]